MNQLRQTAHMPIAALSMEAETGQKSLTPMAITTLIFTAPTHGGPTQVETVTWKWGPDEIREFAAKILKVADELDQVVKPLGMPAPITRPEAFDLVEKLIELEKQKALLPFGEEGEVLEKILAQRATLALGGWSFEELSREIGSDVKDKFDALERARKIVALTCRLGRVHDKESPFAENLRKEISLGALALQAAGYDVEKLTLAVALEGEGCGCGGTPDDKIHAENSPNWKIQIGEVILTVTENPTTGTDVQLDPSARVTAQNLVEAFQRNGVNAEVWAEGNSLIVRELRHPLDYTMRTVTHWRIKDGDGEELILGGTEEETRELARQQLVGDPPTGADAEYVTQFTIEAVKTVPMKEMDFRALREFQG